VELHGDDVPASPSASPRVSPRSRTLTRSSSRTVVDLVAGSELRFDDRGSHDLKGVPGTWQLRAVR
jgi:hypothetical protein